MFGNNNRPCPKASLADLLAWQALRTPGKTAVIHPIDKPAPSGRPAYASVDYAEFASTVTVCAAGLKGQGFRRGTRTALLLTPGADLLTLAFSLIHIGAVPVIVDPGMGVGPMLDCIRRVGVQAFIGVPSAHVLRRLHPRVFADVRSVIKVGRRSGTGLTRLTELGTGLPVPPAVPSRSDDLALIGYTTGSTGPAKPVEVTVAMLWGMASGIEAGHFTADMTTTLVTMPLMGLFDLVAGRTVVVPKMDMSRVAAAEPALLTDAIQRFGVNAMFASPALLGPFSAHLDAGGERVPSLRLIVSGGAPAGLDLMRSLRGVLPEEARVFSTYGATEALRVALVESREALAAGSAAGLGVCVGRPTPGMSVRISDRRLPTGRPSCPCRPMR
ncbi:AMP-binding protein [Streptomyces sp. NPDC005533]|uniref:AMP-binding protein n=1 Tax=Streptomyces sp. NPDC005533 TaxID=3364723 RepID=UPI0036C43D5F